MITLIAALGKNRELGKDNELIWHLPNDLKRFKKVTSSHAIIMGRKTFESLGKPLPNRTNIVITRNKNYKAQGAIVVNSIEEALHTVKDDNSTFIIGGAEIYKLAMPLADKLDLTFVDAELNADAFFPEIDRNIWKETSREDFSADEKHKYNYSFVTFLRK